MKIEVLITRYDHPHDGVQWGWILVDAEGRQLNRQRPCWSTRREARAAAAHHLKLIRF